jgi:hypothetical protein
MNVEHNDSPPLKPMRTLEELFIDLVNAGYTVGVAWQDTLSQDDDVTQLQLSNWLDETMSLCSLLDMRREAQI